MAQTAIRRTTTVRPDQRIEVATPELAEGDRVEVIVLRTEPAGSPKGTLGVWDWLRSLPPVERTAEEWAEVERELRADRDTWER